MKPDTNADPIKIIPVENGYIFVKESRKDYDMTQPAAVFRQLDAEALEWLNTYFKIIVYEES